MSLLDISNLTLALPNNEPLLRSVSLTVAAGETVGLVGESGSGKSLTARAALGLFPMHAAIGGSVRLDGQEVIGASTRQILDLRRHSAAMIFQDPRAGVNPMRTIGDHMTESLRLCEGVPSAAARKTALDLLAAVQLPRPADHLHQYPHEFSGGMLQRVMIAGALTSSPRLLICDEPTTALDVTTQAGIVRLLSELATSRGMGMLFITHDLNLAASLCDRVCVMSHGVIEETGTARDVFLNPSSAYTKRLVAATPQVSSDADPSPRSVTPSTGFPVSALDTMLSIRGLSKTYRQRGHEAVTAVIDADLEVPRGGAVAVVGESGSGKSTLARMIVGLEQADAGDIIVAGRDRTLQPHSRAERIAHAKSVQMVFQDPYLSLDPRVSAGKAIEDALQLHGRLTSAQSRTRTLELLDAVGLTSTHATARPRTLSGGQRQRVAIARAIAVEPDLLVMDEATSALDVSVQAQVLDMVARIQRNNGLTLLFISHDLAVVRSVCETTIVMQRGRIVESGASEMLLTRPHHPYTQLLLDSVPRAAWQAENSRVASA